ncbi:hypothetical protein A1Q1_00362 [Trichosporon asahii var. asahii CBS 2479]|uniref:Afadin and alpha-actinin-binding-domain-containing protein n=1 Tax=Trichosporon asahii var. asahii (strain ATCC 90039 / CBS 2479 / JCM 2466 / KCTC 7840 / NBRC 103889/ NCYC 2677 / UAMH 7654) TaxID=1186058 RepID=J6F0C0_TRIAS|nr:hypothetical protein A1Q1_00362 [Trichosporon asahii var. asahii CBS 2479]EJT50384.1 hypothetical protein A1Q1_00362 [Trichosporon asahii var. asahii CBS 2479]
MPGTPVRNVNNPFEPIILKRVRPALVHHHDSMADSPPLSPLKVHSVSSLNTQLLAHGFAKRPLRLDNLTDAEQINVTSVIVELLGANVVSAGPHFLQTIGISCSSPTSHPSLRRASICPSIADAQNNLNRLEDLSARHRSLQFEWECLSEKVERQAKSISKLEHDVEHQKSRAAEAERKASAEERESAKLRHEIDRGKRNLETLRTAAQQETKRQQIKLDKLTAAPRHQLPNFTLLNPIAPGTTAPAAPGPLPLLENGIRDLDALRQSATEEAEAFRHVIVGIANGLNEALAWSEGRDVDRILLAEFFEMSTRHGQASSWTAHPSIADIKLKRLLEDVRERLMEGPAPSAVVAEEEDPEAAARERERQRREADLRDRVKDLEVEVGIARAKEEEAQKVVEEMARTNAAASVPSTTDFADQKLRDELVRQKRLLDAERDELTRAQLSVAEERLGLEEARRTFEERRAEEIERAMREREAEREEEAKRKADEDSDDDEPVGHEHRPSKPSPLSPHRKRHVKKRPRPSLQRLVVEKQHHAKACSTVITPESTAPSAVSSAPSSSSSTTPPISAEAGPSSSQTVKRTPPAEKILSEGGEKANASNASNAGSAGSASGETPMLGGARLLKAGVTLRKTSSDRPRKKTAKPANPTSKSKPPVSAGIRAVKRTPDSARKPTLEAAGIRKSFTMTGSLRDSGGASGRSSTGSVASVASVASGASGASDSGKGVAPGMTPSQSRLLSGTAASNAKARRVETERARLGKVWK